MAGAALGSCPIQIPGLHGSPPHRPLYGGGSAPSHRSEAAAGGAGKARAYATDHYATLGISPGTSKQEIKSAYRRLALKYHPDVCKDEQSAHKFKQIKSAYECAMNAAASPSTSYMDECYFDSSSITWEGLMGVNDDSWEEWEEWMGWEGAGIRDYTSHINIHQ